MALFRIEAFMTPGDPEPARAPHAVTADDVRSYAWSHLLARFRNRSFRERRRIAAGLCRWVIRMHWFETRHPVLLGPGVRLARYRGRITTGGVCIIGRGCRLGICGHGEKPAHLHIGEGTEIGPRTIINVSDSVSIGNRCSISWDCDITDSDFHQIILSDGTRPPMTAPIVIEDDVWIGNHAFIYKGVRIGRHAVVGAGAVVRHDVPAYALVIGNPARRVGFVQGWER